VPVERLTTITGKFAVTDYFDNNTYSHDPRTQFMNWALMYNGAWDYSADTRGYTMGTMEELTMKQWSLRVADVLEPTVANGPTLDFRVAKNRGDIVEWERRYMPRGHLGVARILGFANHEDAGTYREAPRVKGIPDLAPTCRNGTLKYGFGVNMEQSITSAIGVFGRYGWNDGKTESWAFTEIDRSLSGGISINGKLLEAEARSGWRCRRAQLHIGRPPGFPCRRRPWVHHWRRQARSLSTREHRRSLLLLASYETVDDHRRFSTHSEPGL
jgi:high affinity Mn2+ porin